MGRKQKFTPDDVIAALRETKGMVYLAAQRLGCNVGTLYNYRDRYASVRAEMEYQDGLINDIAEMKLYQGIMSGEQWAVVFRLRTKAKNRGYSERTEITGADGKAIEAEVSTAPDLSKLTLDELRLWRALVEKATPDAKSEK